MGDVVYIKKTQELVKGIPKLKNEIIKLRDQADKRDIKKYNAMLGLLKFLVCSLEKLGSAGDMLVDVYFNGMTKTEVAQKYGYDYNSVLRILNNENTETWYRLSVLLYGYVAVRMEK